MSVTIYGPADLLNIARNGSLNNCVDNGSGFNLALVGSDSNSFVDAQCSSGNPLSYGISADIDHSSPLNPIPITAHITNVRVNAFANGSASASTSGHLNSGSSARLAATVNIDASIGVQTAGGVQTEFNQSDSHQSPSGTPPADLSTSAVILNSGVILRTEYDIANDPVNYPLGYMLYADFIAAFSSTGIGCNAGGTAGIVSGNWGQFTTSSTACSFNLTTSNWEMVVTWEEPVVVPITIDTPNPAVGSQVQLSPNGVNIQKISLGNNDCLHDAFVLFPNSPFVSVWTDIIIKFILPPDALEDQPPTVPVTVDYVDGTTFHGSVPLGSLTVIYADLSGIYQLDDTVHHDELYDRTDEDNPTTEDMLIPPPMFVTSFVGDNEEDISHFVGTRVRTTGVGNLIQYFHSFDNINNEQLVAIPMIPINNVQPFSLANFIDQRGALRCVIFEIDEYFNVSKIIIFAKALYTGYPQ
jgi:hypothetical protein